MNLKRAVPRHYRILLKELVKPPYGMRWWQLGENLLWNLRHRYRGHREGNIVYAFWSNNLPNFGDFITPALLKHHGFSPVHAFPHQAQLASTGSILEKLPSDYSGIILGSGLIEDRRDIRFPNATLLAVRGKLTRQRIDAPPDIALGDPGLLASLLYPSALVENDTSRPLIGLVPHYVDWGDARLQLLLQRYPAEIALIDVRRAPELVCRDIARCRYIISSSLHGLITADSYGIPSAWMELSQGVTGAGFKFHDYYSAFECDFTPVSLKGTETLSQLVELTHPPCEGVSTVQKTLYNLFANLDTWLSV